jgi:hypothetical protein
MRSTAGMLLALLAFWLSGLKGVGATRIPSRTYSSACGYSSEGGAVLRCEKRRAPEAEPRAPSKAKQAAESGAALHGFIYAYALHHSPLSFSLLCSYSPPAPSRFSSERGAALPSLLARACLYSFLRVASLANKQTTRRIPPSKARPVLFVALFLFEKLKARRPKLPCLSEALDLMQSTVSLPLKLMHIELRAVAPADDDRLNPRPPQWCSFSLCLL